MVDLPKKKVGIVACSGEELAEGTVTRLASLQVLEQLRPQDTVTICLPLFLAGGEGDRAFARFYPTIAVDGCGLRCAARATEMYSGKPAASIVVTDTVSQNGLDQPHGLRRLDEAGLVAVDVVAQQIAETVDRLLGQKWSRRTGVVDDLPMMEAVQADSLFDLQKPVEAACSCGSGIPVRKLVIEGQNVTLVALPLIFENFHEQGKLPENSTARELLDTVRLYNPIPSGAEEAYAETLLREYALYRSDKEAVK
jgi:uncharacterized metal-binding protein